MNEGGRRVQCYVNEESEEIYLIDLSKLALIAISTAYVRCFIISIDFSFYKAYLYVLGFADRNSMIVIFGRIPFVVGVNRLDADYLQK